MALASTGAPAPVSPCADEPAPLDLHALYRQQSACGYSHDLLLQASNVQGITARLRGITAITSIFIAAIDNDTLRLSDWMRSGLIEAAHALAQDVYSDIERAADRAAKAQKTH